MWNCLVAKWVGVRKTDDAYVKSKYDDPDSLGGTPKIYVMDYTKDENPFLIKQQVKDVRLMFIDYLNRIWGKKSSISTLFIWQLGNQLAKASG
jgi:hypothetical protein